MDPSSGCKNKSSNKQATKKPAPLSSPGSSPVSASKRPDLKTTPQRANLVSTLVPPPSLNKSSKVATPSPPSITKTAIKLTTQDVDDPTVATKDSTVDFPLPSSARASRQAILKSANEAVKDNYLWSYERDGKFSGAQCNNNWPSLPSRVLSTSTSYRYYHNKKESDDRSSIHDMSQSAFPGIFDLSCVASSHWRQAPVSEVLAFAQDLFQSPSPDWLGTTEVIRARKCMASLALTRPDKFENLYSNRNMHSSTEGVI